MQFDVRSVATEQGQRDSERKRELWFKNRERDTEHGFQKDARKRVDTTAMEKFHFAVPFRSPGLETY